MWLERPPLSNQRLVGLAHCFNENCDVTAEDFWQPILADVELAKIGLLTATPLVAPPAAVQRPSVKARMPEGFRKLTDLPENHPALEFVRRKYKLDVSYLSERYGVGFCESVDMVYPQAQNRVVFPIYSKGELVSWQGRVVYPDDPRPRWFLPPGFIKVVYNIDNVLPTSTPILAEGIPSAIACGPNGVALFGKTITDTQLDRIASTWSTVIVATDPETFVPDEHNRVQVVELKRKLDRRLKVPAKLIKWPASVLDIARRKFNGDGTVTVPDPADFGLETMKKLLER
jgi:hypothetical protein